MLLRSFLSPHIRTLQDLRNRARSRFVILGSMFLYGEPTKHLEARSDVDAR